MSNYCDNFHANVYGELSAALQLAGTDYYYKQFIESENNILHFTPKNSDPPHGKIALFNLGTKYHVKCLHCGESLGSVESRLDIMEKIYEHIS